VNLNAPQLGSVAILLLLHLLRSTLNYGCHQTLFLIVFECQGIAGFKNEIASKLVALSARTHPHVIFYRKLTLRFVAQHEPSRAVAATYSRLWPRVVS
jgi:hypothetical protein